MDAWHVTTIIVTDPEYNTFIRFHALQKNQPISVKSEYAGSMNCDLLVLPAAENFESPDYSQIFQNSSIKAYKSLERSSLN